MKGTYFADFQQGDWIYCLAIDDKKSVEIYGEITSTWAGFIKKNKAFIFASEL